MVHDIGLSPIDVGLRDHEMPRDARTARRRRSRAPRSQQRPTSPTCAVRVIVKFKAGTAPSAMSSATSQVSGAMAAGRAGWADFDIVDIPMDSDVEAAAATLRARSDVEYAQPRYLNHAMARPNDPMYSNQWNFPAIDMERAWDIQPGATSNIIVAVLDSGVAFRTITLRYNSRFPFRVTTGGPVYPALGVVDVPFAAAPELGEAGSTRFVLPRDFIWDDELPVDLDSHGTHVTGTIGQLTNNGVGVAGMAYNVRIMPVKIIQGVWDDMFDSPFAGTDDVVARGIRYAADNGAKVINLSIGRSEGGPATGRHRGDPLRGRQRRVRRGGGRQHEGHRQPAQPARRRRARHRRHDAGGRGRTHARRGVLLHDDRVRRDRRAGRRPARRRHQRRASCSRRSISICSKRSNGRPRSSARRGRTRLATTISRARRWRCRTSRASRRC